MRLSESCHLGSNPSPAKKEIESPFSPKFGADMYALYCTLAKECKFYYYISMSSGKKLGENLRKLRLKKEYVARRPCDSFECG